MKIARLIAGIALTLSLLALAACSWWFAAIHAQILYSALSETRLQYIFDASESTSNWTTIREYEWDFGDGTVSTGESAFHTYQSEGTYTVELTVGNGHGVSDTATVIVHASIPQENEAPNAGFSVDPTSGEAPLEVEFDASASSDTDGNIANYAWRFGNGSTGSGREISHTYSNPGTYTVTLTVADDEGETDTASRSIRVTDAAALDENVPPTADLDATPIRGDVPLLVEFDATGSSDPDGDISTYFWDFGDGTTLADGIAEPSHVYTADGAYDVELTVIDNDGATDTTTATITVDEADTPGNDSPTAEFTVSPDRGDAPLLVDFDAGSSSDPDGTVEMYYWEFGDGQVLADGIEEPSHVYTNPGTYDVTLTVIDDDGASNSASQEIVVLSTDAPPNAWFSATPDTGQLPLEVSFDASASTDPDGVIVDYDWDFGDGATGTGVSPNHVFPNKGVFDVALIVTDDDGHTDQTSRDITVVAPPIPMDLYVDANDGSDEAGDGSQANPYKTITKAASTIPIGDAFEYTIHMQEGIYNLALGEVSPLVLEDTHLQGEGATRNDVIIVLEIEARGSFSMTNLTSILRVSFHHGWGDESHGDVTLDNVCLEGNVDIASLGPVLIADCDFKAGDLDVYGHPEELTVVRNVFENNSFQFYGQSVLIEGNEGECSLETGTGNLVIQDNNLEGSTIAVHNTTTPAIIQNNSASTITLNGSSSALVSGNVLVGTWVGIIVDRQASAEIENNEIRGHEIGVLAEYLAIVDLGGGALGSVGGNIFADLTSYAIDDDRVQHAGPISAKDNTWDDPQPAGTVVGPVDNPPNCKISNEGNSIIFSD